MKLQNVLLAALLIVTTALTFSQWQLQRALERVTMQLHRAERTMGERGPGATGGNVSEAASALERLNDQLQHMEARLAALGAQQERELGTRRSERGPRRATTPELRMDLTEPSGEAIDPLEGGVTNGNKRGWGPEQMTGAPDTFQAGDISTAWAPMAQDGGTEWAALDFERAVEIAEVRVRETYNPGAISKITALLPNGSETVLWEGVEPPAEAPVDMSFSVPPGTVASSVKVYLETSRVPGWNEIDAVELVGRDGSRQWARHAKVSSSYAVRERNF
jgi:hypothetical protein